MGMFIKQLGTFLVGKMAGSNQKASFVVKTFRTAYVASAGAIAVAWYSAYRNERVAPNTLAFPFPGTSNLKRQFKPDRPEHEFPQETGTAGSNTPHLQGTAPVATGTAGNYVYPFTGRATIGRIDQGQDFGGTGPIFAPGDSKVVSVGAPGWPGGGGVVMQFLNGERAGHYYYIFEGIQVEVRQNQIVKAGQRVGTFIPFSPTGIEIGFCDSNGVPTSHSEYTEGKVTRGGKEMAAFLHSLRMHPPVRTGGQPSTSPQLGHMHR